MPQATIIIIIIIIKTKALQRERERFTVPRRQEGNVSNQVRERRLWSVLERSKYCHKKLLGGICMMLKPPAPSSSPKLRLCPTKSERGVHSSSEPRGKCQQPSDGESGDCGAFWSVGRSTIKRFETAASPPRYKRESSPLENLTSAPDSHQESAWEVARASVAFKD